MSDKPNFKLLRDAFAILDGIPDEAFDLDAWTVEQGKRLSCGTIACAGGWLARHPKFKRLGLYIDGDGDVRLKKNGSAGGKRDEAYDYLGFSALVKAFSLSNNLNEDDLFNSRAHGYRDRELMRSQLEKLTDRQLWKRRVLRLFQLHNEPFDPKVGEGLFLDARYNTH